MFLSVLFFTTKNTMNTQRTQGFAFFVKILCVLRVQKNLYYSF